MNTVAYAYDLASQLTSASDDFSAYSYTYDRLGRLSRIRLRLRRPRPETAYTYDAVGNRTSLTDPVGNTTTWADVGIG